MDLNLVVLAGRIAAPPELRELDSGTRLARFLVAVRSTMPQRRVDVVPITLWDPGEDLLGDLPSPGRRLWVAGSVQRRFREAADGRRSRLEIVAHQIEVVPEEMPADAVTAGS